MVLGRIVIHMMEAHARMRKEWRNSSLFVSGLADGVLDFTSGREFVNSLKHLLPKKGRNKVRLKKRMSTNVSNVRCNSVRC